MSTDKIQTNYPEFSAEDIPDDDKYVRLRSAPQQGEDPLTWQQIDNNFEIIKYAVNSVIDDVERFGISTSTYVQDEIIITWQPDATDEQKQEVIDAYELELKYELV
jgi:hypothetical protein